MTLIRPQTTNTLPCLNRHRNVLRPVSPSWVRAADVVFGERGGAWWCDDLIYDRNDGYGLNNSLIEELAAAQALPITTNGNGAMSSGNRLNCDSDYEPGQDAKRDAQDGTLREEQILIDATQPSLRGNGNDAIERNAYAGLGTGTANFGSDEAGLVSVNDTCWSHPMERGSPPRG